MKKMLAITTAVTLSLGGAMVASPAMAVPTGNPTFATSTFYGLQGSTVDWILGPTFSGDPSFYYGSRAYLDTESCGALPAGLSYVQDGVENGPYGDGPTYEIAGTISPTAAPGAYDICFWTDQNPEGWSAVGTSQVVTINVLAPAVTASVATVSQGESVTITPVDPQDGSFVGWFIDGVYVDGDYITGFPKIYGYNDFTFEDPTVDHTVTWALYDSPQLEALLVNARSTVDVTWVAPAVVPTATGTNAVNGVVGETSASEVLYSWTGFDFSGGATLASSGLPDGVSVYVDGYNVDGSPIIRTSGAPTAIGTYTSTITITAGGKDASFNFDFYVTGAVEPINSSNPTCYDADSGFSDVNNTVAYYESICNLTGTLSDAGTTNTDDAYDTFGRIKAYNWDGSTFEINATQVLTNSPGVYNYVSSNIWSTDAKEYVDVYVHRSFVGNTASWTVHVYKTGTETPSTLNIFIEGNLGSDEDTTWETVNGILTSSDGFIGDPVILWNGNGEFDVAEGDDDVTVNFGATNGAYLNSTLVGYQSCATSADIIAQVNTVTGSLETYLDTNIPDVAGACAEATFTVDNNATFTNGTDSEEGFTVTANDVYNWSNGGTLSLDGLPDGLTYTVNSEWVESTVPSFDVSGSTTATPGVYTVTVTLNDDYGNSSTATFTVTVEAAGPVVIDANLGLNIPVGGNINGAGADYSAEGLQDGSAWTLTLRSTPQVIASGIATASGIISGTALIPAGLEAGWHSITLTGTDVNGSPVSKVVWFEIAADGTVLAEQDAEPTPAPTPEPAANTEGTLPHTGFAGADFLFGSLAALGSGIAILMFGAYRRREESTTE